VISCCDMECVSTPMKHREARDVLHSLAKQG
jgi:hypothetical protein